MGDLSTLGRVLVGIGMVFVIAGLVILLASRVPLLDQLGRLPGDLVIRRGNATIYIPILTSILVSVFLTLILAVVFRR